MIERARCWLGGLVLLFCALVQAQSAGIEHTLVAFSGARKPASLHRIRLRVAEVDVGFVDLGYMTPLVEARGSHDLLINGGYWAYDGPHRKIQGLLVVNGKRIAPRAPTLSGGVLAIEKGRASLHAHDWTGFGVNTVLAVQCNPRLVVDGKVVEKLESKRFAARTALCVRDGGATLDAYLTAEGTRLTLVELANFLLEDGCEQALNLDGGPSTAAVFRDGEHELRVGSGYALPYGIGFTAKR